MNDITGRLQEYSMLREEIMFLYKQIDTYYSLTYTITITVFGYAISLLKDAHEIPSAYPYIFLLPLIIILTSIVKVNRNQIEIVKISAYMLVFLENETGICWESIHHACELKSVKKRKSIRFHSLSMWILVLLCILLWILVYIMLNKRWTILFLLALIPATFFIYDRKFDNWAIIREKEIENWEKCMPPKKSC